MDSHAFPEIQAAEAPVEFLSLINESKSLARCLPRLLISSSTRNKNAGAFKHVTLSIHSWAPRNLRALMHIQALKRSESFPCYHCWQWPQPVESVIAGRRALCKTLKDFITRQYAWLAFATGVRMETFDRIETHNRAQDRWIPNNHSKILSISINRKILTSHL